MHGSYFIVLMIRNIKMTKQYIFMLTAYSWLGFLIIIINYDI